MPATVKLNSTARFDFSVFDENGAVVTGLVNGNFTKDLAKDGATSAVAVTVTEIATGMYSATLTPTAVGEWFLRVRHATYNAEGWSQGFSVVRNTIEDFFLAIEQFVYMDRKVYDSTSLQLTSARIRLFDSKANADAATDGGTAQAGTIATYVVTAVLNTDGTLKTYKKVRDDTQA